MQCSPTTRSSAPRSTSLSDVFTLAGGRGRVGVGVGFGLGFGLGLRLELGLRLGVGVGVGVGVGTSLGDVLTLPPAALRA